MSSSGKIQNHRSTTFPKMQHKKTETMNAVTLKNCNALVIEKSKMLSGDIPTQAAAWNIVHIYLCERGMKNNAMECNNTDKIRSGIENVIHYLENNLK